MRGAARIGIPLVALALLACDAMATEIVVVVDTDIATLDRFEIRARYPSGEIANASAMLDDQAPPRTLVFRYRGGGLGPLWFEVSGWEGEAQVVAVQREVAFERDRSLTLRVFLADGCRAPGCEEGETCSNDGACRRVSVEPCEYEGRSCNDAGAAMDGGGPDAGDGLDGGSADAGVDANVDGGPCPFTAICGTNPVRRVGDRVRPTSCTVVDEPFDVIVTGPSGEIPPDSSGEFYMFGEPGTYSVRFEIAGLCDIETAVLVEGAFVTIVDDSGLSGELRDLAGRESEAFVASADGPLGVSQGAGWVALRDDSDINPVPTDMAAVTMWEQSEPIFGPNTNTGFVYRLGIQGDLSGDWIDYMDIPDGRVTDLRVELDGGTRLAIATENGLVVARRASPWDFYSVGPSFVPTWAAVAERSSDAVGGGWVGDGAQIVNTSRDSTTRTLFNGGSPVTPPAELGVLRGLEVDDQEDSVSRQRVWLCGESGVAVYSLDHEWSTLSAMPEPLHRWAIPCHDIAVADDQERAFIATGADTVGLVNIWGGEARLGASAGLPAGGAIERVYVWVNSNDFHLWALDPAAREVYLLER